ncbi:MAG: hypothetical protein VYD19_00440, partial [Myxococcota bacterium]|nr:hypothetical protein [Myxococcota bacterium]
MSTERELSLQLEELQQQLRRSERELNERDAKVAQLNMQLTESKRELFERQDILASKQDELDSLKIEHRRDKRHAQQLA